LFTAKTKTLHSLLWLAAIQIIERKQYLPGLAPNAGLFPPGGLIAAAMHLAVMSAAKRNRKLVADLVAECRYLRKPQVVSISGASAANQTGLLGNRCNVLPVAYATRRRE